MNAPSIGRSGGVCSCAVMALMLAAPGTARGVNDDSTIRERLTLVLHLPPIEACDAIEKLLESDAPEADREACLRELAKRLPAAAAPPTASETLQIDALRERSAPVAEVLAGRFVIVLAGEDFARGARDSNLVTWLDLAYVVIRNLLGFDPDVARGGRLLIHPDRDLADGWRFDPASHSIAVGREAARYGTWRHAIARELMSAFTCDHPARHLFREGFSAGWSDFAPAFVAQRLSFFEGPFRDKFDASRKEFATGARAEYLDTRLSIEEIGGANAAPDLLVRLALSGSLDPSKPDWRPLRKLCHEAQRGPFDGVPAYLSTARLVRDIQRAFGADRVRSLLGEYRFPLDSFSAAELERAEKRQSATKPPPQSDIWKQDGEIVLGDWRRIGPFVDARSRGLDFDPLDAANCATGAVVEFDGSAYTWQSDVAIDDAATILLAACGVPSVTYLSTVWPASISKPSALIVASDHPFAVWVGGELVLRERAALGARPDAARRVFLPKLSPGTPIVVEIAGSGDAAAVHVRAGGGTPFDYAYRVEVRSPDQNRRLAAVRFLGAQRAPAGPLIELLAVALGDNDREVRAAAAKALGGRRNEPSAVEALITRFGLEKESLVTSAIQAALEELTFVHFDASASAYKWWRSDEAKRWKQSSFAECEDAPVSGTLVGGAIAASPAAFGDLCIDGFGEHATDVLGVVVEADSAAPRVLRLRYTSARDGGRIALRVRRGEHTVFLREGVELARTRDWNQWTWLEVPLGEIPAGRHQVELLLPNGRVQCDVMGWVVR